MRKSILAGAGLLLGSVWGTFELPATPMLLARSDNSTTTSTAWSTSTTWATVTYTLPSSSSSPALATSYLAAVSSSSTYTVPLSHSFSLVTEQNLITDVTSTILETTTVTVIAQPMVTVYMESPAFLHNSQPPASMLDHTSSLSMMEARDTVYESNKVTQYVTTFVATMTLTALWNGPLPPPTTVTGFQTMSASQSTPPPGVTVTDVTSVITITQHADNSMMSATADSTNATTSWLHISTFIATGLSTWANQPLSSATASVSNGPTINTSTLFLDTTLPSSTSTAFMTDNVGHKGATTVALDPQYPQSEASQVMDSDGMLVAVAAAMGACVGLAFLL